MLITPLFFVNPTINAANQLWHILRNSLPLPSGSATSAAATLLLVEVSISDA
jgi:hypothetical protein